jgi:hypothetical protein
MQSTGAHGISENQPYNAVTIGLRGDDKRVGAAQLESKQFAVFPLLKPRRPTLCQRRPQRREQDNSRGFPYDTDRVPRGVIA